MKYIHVFFVILCLVSCRSINRKHIETISPCGIELYYSLGGLSPELKQDFSEQGFNQLLLINQRRIVNENDEWSIDENRLTKFVNERISNYKSNEYVVLNWEGEVYKAIRKGPDSPDFIRASELFIKAYDIVKKIRPYTRVGYYGFPIREYWKRDDNWKLRNRTLDDFLSHFDVLYPSLYDFYDSGTYQGKGDLAYVHDNVQEALLMGIRLNKPVLPFIWHRYHTSNKLKARELIPVDEFIDHVTAAASVNEGGKSIDGVIWWGSEYSAFAKKNISIYKDKNALRSAWESVAQEILPEYFRALERGVERACKA